MWIVVLLVIQVWLVGCVSCRGYVLFKEEDFVIVVVFYIFFL